MPRAQAIGHEKNWASPAEYRRLAGVALVRNRLLAIHLHDNNGLEDEHRLPFNGTVNWLELTAIIASSSYRKCISLEVSVRKETFASEAEFLRQAFAAGQRLTAMVAEHRGQGTS